CHKVSKSVASGALPRQAARASAEQPARGRDGLNPARVDGTDFFKVAAVARADIDHIRSGEGPVCLVADVVRLLPHSSSDNHAKYRSPEDLEKDRQIDPIARMEMALIESGMFSQEDIA